MITYEIDKISLDNIEKQCFNMPNKMPDILRKSVNEAANKTKKRLVIEAQKRYMIKTSRFNKATKIKRASTSTLQAIIKANGSVLELRDYKVTPNRYANGKNRPSVFKGQVVKSGSPKSLEVGGVKAFITKFKSGHIAVVQRVAGKRMKSNPSKEFLKKLLSPSVPTMLGSEKKVYGVVSPEIPKYLQESLRKYMN